MVQLVGSSSLGLGKLIDGKNQFVHIRYSANADGSNMTAEIQANTKYIGIMTSSSETPPTNPSDYSWGRFVGTSGTSSYTWIRYSPNEDGSSMTTTANEETKYIGVAITSENSAPTDYTRYSWALFKGNDGRGVEKTEVSYQKSTSGIVIPTGSWETTIPSLDDGEYLWTKTLFTYTDDTTTSTFSVSRNGTAGLGISGTDVHYQKSTSGTTAPTGTWTATIPNVGPNEYLWTRTTMSYTDGSTRVSYSVGKMGADGRDAQLLYLTASSQIQAFDKDNQPKTTQPITISVKLQNASGTATFTAIPYIGNTAQTPITLGGTGNDRTLLPSQWANTEWTIIAITATLGSLTDTISINKVKDGATGPKGDDGIAGKDGVGIASTSITYAQSTSGTVAPASGWTEQVPTLIKEQYLWTKTTWTYTDASTETGYTVSYNAKDGNDGNDGIAGKDGVGIASTLIQYVGSASGTTKPTSGWSTSIPTVPNGQYLWTKTTWTYTDGTSESGYSVAKMGETGPKGDKGNDGIAGADGVGLRTTAITYGISDSETTQPTSWNSQVPTLVKGKYLWTKTVWTYTDNSTETGYQKTYIARDGNNGADGLPGRDGVGIASTSIQYAASTSGTTHPTSGWSSEVPSVPGGQYLWTKIVWTYTDNTTETGYSVARMGERGPQGLQGIQGPKGDQGIAGPAGADGRTSYTHIAYADSADGTVNFSVSDSNRKYIGVYVDFNQTDSTNPSSYQWSLIKGADGADGLPGRPGADGRTPYFHTAYANSADGSSGFSTTDSNGKLYLGTCTDYNQSDPTDYHAYTWVKIKGDKGDTGNGISSTTITYGVSSSGTTPPTSWSSTIPTVSPSNYLWTKTVITYTNNATTTSYSVGRMGEQGAKGDKGDTGATLYTWVKYADNANGGGMSDYPSGKRYIGLAYNKPTATESSTASDYQWALIQGEQGIQGAKGDTGATLYTWLKYADTDAGAGMSDSPAGKRYIGLAYNKTTATESTNPGDYTWSLIQGPQGPTGPAGQNGRGVSSYSITYQAGTSGTTTPTGTWTTTIPSVPQGQYLWTKMVITYTDNTSSTSYSVSYIPNNGATGNGVSSIITEFYLSTSKTTQSGGSWTTTQPTWSPGKYVWTRNKITYTNGSTAYTTPQCSSEWEAVNNLQVGGRNLLRNTKDEYTVSISNLSSWVEGRVFDIEPTKNGEQYVLSFEAKASENGYIMQNHWWYRYSGSQNPVIKAVDQDGNVQIDWADGDGATFLTLTTEYKRYYIVFDVRDSVGTTNIIVGRLNDRSKLPNTGWVKIKEFKLEKGNKPTDWSPAPEDTQDQIDQANENISNKVDQGAYDTDQATIWGSINSKMDDAEFRAYKAVMDNLKSSYEAFVGEGGRFEQELQNATAREQAIVQELGAQVQQLNFINTYIRESEEGIVIGAKNNPMQMLLSKDSLSFMDGGQTVAYFSNQSFYINRGAVVESLQVGVHKLTKIDNYHTVIQYIPN